MGDIIIYINQGTQLITSIGAFVVAAISVYYLIRNKIREEAKADLRKIAITEMAKSIVPHITPEKTSGPHTIYYWAIAEESIIESGVEAVTARGGMAIKLSGLRDKEKIEAFVSRVYDELAPIITEGKRVNR